MAKFYTNSVTGKLHFVADAGGRGGDQTSVFDGIATPEDIAANPGAYRTFQLAPVLTTEQQAAASVPFHIVNESQYMAAHHPSAVVPAPVVVSPTETILREPATPSYVSEAPVTQPTI